MTDDATKPAKAMPNTRLTAFAAKARDLDTLRNSVADAAGVGAGLWFSYLFVLFYLAIAVGGVTHQDLWFENQVKLPFLNQDLPLIGFFVLGPGIFLVIHTYVLLHFVLLADKVGVFHAELRAQIADEDTRGRLRRQLPSNIFVQFLAGPREMRAGVIGLLLRLIAQISLIAGPLALLVLFQLTFLPFHDEAVSWWQRIALVIDLALLWTLWPSVGRGEITWITWHDLLRRRVAAAALSSLAVVLLVFTIATFPGEALDRYLPSVRFVPIGLSATQSDGVSQNRPGSTGRREAVASVRWTSLHELLLQGDVDLVARKPKSLWSNRLVLPGIDMSDRERIGTLRGRRLEGAVLIGAHLSNVDFAAARLQGAKFDGADLRQAKFCDSRVNVEDPRWPSVRSVVLENCAQTEGATFKAAQLHDAVLQPGGSFDYADLRGASLDYADLRKTSLTGAQLQGASLVETQLQQARLNQANLQGAFLLRTQLQGAELEDAQLQGAVLTDTQLEGADLKYAILDGASLEGAELQLADLAQSNLRYVSLVRVKLQGADLARVEMHGAFLDAVEIWRADLNFERKNPGVLVHSLIYESLPSRSFNSLKKRVEPYLLSEDAIDTLDPGKPFNGEKESRERWSALEAGAQSLDTHDNYLAKGLRKLGCDKDGAPYVIRGLLENLDRRFSSSGTLRSKLAGCFLDETECPGARGLSDGDKVKLKALLDHPSAVPSCVIPASTDE